MLVDVAREFVARQPEDRLGWRRLGESLLMNGRAAEALPVLREAVGLHTGDAALRGLLAEALAASGELDAACSSFAQAVLIEPASLEMRLRLVELLVACGHLEEAREEAARLPSATTQAAGAGIRYRQALACLLTGRRSEAAALIAPKDVYIAPLGCPQGFGREEEFRDALREEILANPTLDPALPGKATREGLQTRRFPLASDRAAAVLLSEIQRHVRACKGQVIGPDHDVAQCAPVGMRLDSWAVVGGASTWQGSHIHPNGCLSGVYYVSAPDDLKEGAGDLLLGMLPGACAGLAPWPVKRIAPVPGRLVLFPSCVPHATAATGSNSARIVIAFDLVPNA